jgi:hypothetical protein
MEIPPTISEIAVALRVKLAEIVNEDAEILSAFDDKAADVGKIFVVQIVNPGKGESGELGGRQGLSVQRGVYTVTVSYRMADIGQRTAAWDLAQRIADGFRRESLPAGCCHVNIDDPWMTNAGQSGDKRLNLLVTVPWWAWTGGQDEGA